MASDLRRPPVDVLHMPSIHPGIGYIGSRPDWLLRKGSRARIGLHAASDHDPIRDRQQAGIERQLAQLPRDVLEIRSTPVVLEGARFSDGLVRLGDRLWLNGASGSRARRKFEDQNREDWRTERYAAALNRSRQAGRSSLGLVPEAETKRLPVAIELKNGFNYYHFSTETLGALSHYSADHSGQPISLHLPGSSIKGFIRRFVDQIYPELADRVTLSGRPQAYDRVRSVYSHQHFLYLVQDRAVADLLASGRLDPAWSGILTHPMRLRLAAMQSYDSSLALLRDKALSRIAEERVQGAGRLIWMGRDEGGAARARGLEGQEPLLEELAGRGFAMVAFEHLSPLEQVAAIHQADVVIAPHGAGLANMMYAGPQTTVIEIGTRQTQLHRWGDFLKCAHVAGCRYDTVFADIEGVADPGEVPAMAAGHRGIRIGKRATQRIIAILDQLPEAGRRGHDAAALR